MRADDLYVSAWRLARRGAERTGLLDRLEGSGSPTAHHARTLFAIHDVADMVHLDLAWWSYAAIDEVNALLAGRPAQVFEYGAGASTAWLAARAAQVTSVEHEAGFVEVLTPMLAHLTNVEVMLVPAVRSSAPAVPSHRRGHDGLDFSDYVQAIDTVPGEFDFVVVDGRARVACVRQALPRLANDGVLLLDNADRDEYACVVSDPALDVRVLRGATPCLPYPTSTALIRRR
ncbi:MAG: hypothetical protein WCA29_04505 [Jiangellales bacterium]